MLESSDDNYNFYTGFEWGRSEKLRYIERSHQQLIDIICQTEPPEKDQSQAIYDLKTKSALVKKDEMNAEDYGIEESFREGLARQEEPTKDSFLTLLNDLLNEENKQFLLDEIRLVSERLTEEIKFKDVSSIVEAIFTEASSDFPFAEFLDSFLSKMTNEEQEKLLVLVLSKVGISPMMIAFTGIDGLYQKVKSKNKCIRYSLNLVLKHYDGDLEDKLEVFIENMYRLVFKAKSFDNYEPAELIGLVELFIKGLDIPLLKKRSEQILEYLIAEMTEAEFNREAEKTLINRSTDWHRLTEWLQQRNNPKNQFSFRQTKNEESSISFQDELQKKQMQSSPTEALPEQSRRIQPESHFEDNLKKLESRTQELMRRYQLADAGLEDSQDNFAKSQFNLEHEFEDGDNPNVPKHDHKEAVSRLKYEFSSGIFDNGKRTIEEKNHFDDNYDVDDDQSGKYDHATARLGLEQPPDQVDSSMRMRYQEEKRDYLQTDIQPKRNNFLYPDDSLTKEARHRESEQLMSIDSKNLRMPDSIAAASSIKPKDSSFSMVRDEIKELEQLGDAGKRFKIASDNIKDVSSHRESKGYADFLTDNSKHYQQAGSKYPSKSIEASESSRNEDYNYKFRFEKEKKAHQDTVDSLRELNEAFKDMKIKCLQHEKTIEKLERDKKAHLQEIQVLKEKLEMEQSTRSMAQNKSSRIDTDPEDPFEEFYLFYKSSKSSKERESALQSLLFTMTRKEKPPRAVLEFFQRVSELPDKPFLVDLRDSLHEMKSVKGISRGMYEGLVRFTLRMKASASGGGETSNHILNQLIVTQNIDVTIDSLISILKDEMQPFESKYSKGSRQSAETCELCMIDTQLILKLSGFCQQSGQYANCFKTLVELFSLFQVHHPSKLKVVCH